MVSLGMAWRAEGQPASAEKVETATTQGTWDAWIPKGREGPVRAWVDEARAEVAGVPTLAIEIDRDVVHLGATNSAGESLWVLTVGHPLSPPDYFARLDAVARVVVRVCKVCDAETLAPSQALADALVRLRDDRYGEQIWETQQRMHGQQPKVFRWRDPAVAHTPDAVPEIETPPPAWDAVVIGWAGAIVLWWVSVVLRVLRRRRSGRSEDTSHKRRGAHLAAVLGLATVATLLLSQPWPLHEHNTFVARVDCAFSNACTHDPVGPAWSDPTFRVVGFLLRLLPSFHVQTGVFFGLALSLFAAGLLYILTQQTIPNPQDPRFSGHRIGLLAVALLVFHPVWMRVSVAGTLWPYTLVCVLLACVAGLVHRRSGDPLAAIAAVASLWLACQSNFVCLTLTPLVLAFPLWRRPQTWASVGGWITLLGLYFATLAPAFVSVLEQFVGTTVGDDGGVAVFAQRLLHTQWFVWFDPRFSSRLLAAPAILASLWIGRKLVVFGPLLYAGLAVHVVLSLFAADIFGLSYPVGLIHHVYILPFCALLTAAGVGFLMRGLASVPGFAARRTRNRVVAVWLAAAVLGGLAAREGHIALTQSRVLERELAFLAGSWGALPDHNILVVPSTYVEPLRGLRPDGDPIGAEFPREAYRAAMLQSGRPPGQIVRLPQLMSDPPTTGRVLLYVGSSLRSFAPTEIREGVVPDSLERPELTQLRDRFTLEPVLTRELETHQHPAISQRLGADRVPTIELGFYWLHPREHSDQ